MQRGLCSGTRTLTARALPAAPTERMLEVKRKHDGSTKEFAIESWLWEATAAREVVVGRWLAPKGNEYGLQEGSWSWGVWGAGVFGDVGVGAYRMHQADGSLRGYRFDVLDRAEAILDAASGAKTLIFHDLFLDAWVAAPPELTLTLEDEDEVQEAASKGRLSERELRSECPSEEADPCRNPRSPHASALCACLYSAPRHRDCRSSSRAGERPGAAHERRGPRSAASRRLRARDACLRGGGRAGRGGCRARVIKGVNTSCRGSCLAACGPRTLYNLHYFVGDYCMIDL